jgi:hypothetical protein
MHKIVREQAMGEYWFTLISPTGKVEAVARSTSPIPPKRLRDRQALLNSATLGSI